VPVLNSWTIESIVTGAGRGGGPRKVIAKKAAAITITAPTTSAKIETAIERGRLAAGDISHEHIAFVAHRTDQVFAIIPVELAPQAADLNVDRAIEMLGVAAP